MPIRDWKAALNRFSIEFEDRVPQQWPLTPFTQKFGHPLRDELTTYLQQRFGLQDLRAVTLTDTQRALFPTQKNPKRGFTANTLCQLMHKIYKDAQLTGASSHSGRRGFITKLADKGVGVRVLMALAGHKSIATTQRYIELNPTIMRGAVELIWHSIKSALTAPQVPF